MCRHACPTFLATKMDSHTPRGYALLMSRIDENITEWNDDIVEKLYQCSLCGLCAELCEFHWQEDEMVRAGREEVVKKSIEPVRVKELARNIKETGTIYRKEKNNSIPEKIAVEKQGADVLYFAGCSTRAEHPEILKAMTKILDSADLDWGRLEKENCCSMSLYEMGYTEDARKLAEQLSNKIEEYNPEILVTNCAHCYRSFAEKYKDLGVELPDNLKIMHSTEFIGKLIEEGKFSLNIKETDANFCYHDPCQLGRKMGVFEMPRELIKKATGKAPIELFHNKEEAECCGAGTVRFIIDPKVSIQVADERIKRVIEENADVVITACQNCKRNFTKSKIASQNNIKIMDIVELIADRLL